MVIASRRIFLSNIKYRCIVGDCQILQRKFMANDDFTRGPTKIIFTFKTYTIMNQKEEMYNENNGGGGAGSVQPSNNNESKNEWLKFVAFTAILAVLATCIILAVL